MKRASDELEGEDQSNKARFGVYREHHATLDEQSVVHLRLVDGLVVVGGVLLGRLANGGIKNIPHPMGCEDDPQSAKPSGEV
jgi:hypothetical protein